MKQADDLRLAINPRLDRQNLAARFAADQRIQISDFLTRDSAEALFAELVGSNGWRHVVNGGDKVFEIARSDFERMAEDERARLDTAVIDGAAAGFQFRYDLIRVPDDPSKRLSIEGRLVEFARLMAGPEVLDLLQSVSGMKPLRFADAQATLYRTGDFLTRHDDNVAGKDRKLAYVLGLAEEWQPEWGGLLLFNRESGGVADTFVPRFNTLSLFAVPQPHSVSYVAPFARKPRISVTGWIRSAVPEI